MKLILVLALNLMSSLAFGQFIDGQDRGNGGDQCEFRITQIRNDFQSWILKGGSASLQFPLDITLAQYNRMMMNQMSEAVVSCTETVLTVGMAEKTCLNFRDMNGTPRVLCNVDRFMGAKDADQYVLIHHEYAGLANFEVNSGEKSDYRLSVQIADYYRAQGPNRLDATPARQCTLDPKRPVLDRLASAIYENNLDCVRSLASLVGYLEMALVYRFEPLIPDLPKEMFFTLSPISFAAVLGRTEAINILLDAGLNINFTTTLDYPLSVAAKAGQVEVIKLLVKRGAALDPIVPKLIHPLHAALSNLEENSYPLSKVYSTVKTLLELGVNADAINYGRTTLARAAEQSSLVDLLIKYGASVSTKDHYGRSALYYCRSEACVDQFVRLGTAVNAVDFSGSHAVDIVPTAAAVKALLKHGSVSRRELVAVPRENAAP